VDIKIYMEFEETIRFTDISNSCISVDLSINDAYK